MNLSCGFQNITFGIDIVSQTYNKIKEIFGPKLTAVIPRSTGSEDLGILTASFELKITLILFDNVFKLNH